MLKRMLCFVMGFVILGISISANIYAEDDISYGDHDLIISALQDEGFKTDRLIASRTTKEDVPLLADFLMDKNVTRYLDPTLVDGFDSKETAEKFLLNNEMQYNTTEYCFTIRMKDSFTPIGRVAYTYTSGGMLSINYFLASEYQGCGYASEVILPLKKKIFEASSDVNTFYVSCDYRNDSSYKLADKICGFIAMDADKYICKKSGLNEAVGEFNGREINFKYYAFLLMKNVKL